METEIEDYDSFNPKQLPSKDFSNKRIVTEEVKQVKKLKRNVKRVNTQCNLQLFEFNKTKNKSTKKKFISQK
jgi:hypothetical protein